MTDRTIAGLKPLGDRYDIPDRKIAGLVIRVLRDGTTVWSLRYRIDSDRRRVKLGEYPRLSLAQARSAANAELRKVDGGIDPLGGRGRRPAPEGKQH